MSKYAPLSLVILAFVALVIAGLSQQAAEPEAYPDKPIKMFVGFAAGGSTDLAGRALASELQNILGQPVPVFNQPGAGSMIAARKVAGSRADGYTIWFGSLGTLMLKSGLNHTSLDFFEDFRLIGLTGKVVPAIGVPTPSPYYAVQDIIEAARARPGELRWAHNGMGAAFAAMGASFVSENDLDIVGVPFQGAKGVRLAIFADQVDFGVVSEGERLMFGEKKVRVLASLRNSREGAVDADLPTIGELGLPFVEIDSPVGVLVPKDTPEHVVARLEEAVAQAAASEAFRSTMARLHIAAINLDSEQGVALATRLRSKVQTLLPVLKSRSGAESVATGPLIAPLAVGGLLAILAVIEAFAFLRARQRGVAPAALSDEVDQASATRGTDLQLMFRSAGPLMLIMGVYGLIHGWFGYLIATALCGYAVFALFGNRMNTALVHGSAGAAVLYAIFIGILNIYDPPGTVLDVSHVLR